MISSWVWKRYIWYVLIFICSILGLTSLIGVWLILNNSKSNIIFTSQFYILPNSFLCFGILGYKIFVGAWKELSRGIPGPYIIYVLMLFISSSTAIAMAAKYPNDKDLSAGLVAIPLSTVITFSLFLLLVYSYNYYIFEKLIKANRRKKYKVVRGDYELFIKRRHILKDDIVFINNYDYVPTTGYLLNSNTTNFTFLKNKNKLYSKNKGDFLVSGLRNMNREVISYICDINYKDFKKKRKSFVRIDSFNNWRKSKLNLIINIFALFILVISFILMLYWRYSENYDWIKSIRKFNECIALTSPIYFVYLVSLNNSFATMRSIRIGAQYINPNTLDKIISANTIVVNSKESILEDKYDFSRCIGEDKYFAIAYYILKINNSKICNNFWEQRDNIEKIKSSDVKFRDCFTIKIGNDLYEIRDASFISEKYITNFTSQNNFSFNHSFPSVILLKNNEVVLISQYKYIIAEKTIEALQNLKKQNVNVISFSNDNKTVTANTTANIGVYKSFSLSMKNERQTYLEKEKKNKKIIAGMSDNIELTDINIQTCDYVIAGNNVYEKTTNIKKTKVDCFLLDTKISTLAKIVTWFKISNLLRIYSLFIIIIIDLFYIVALMKMPELITVYENLITVLLLVFSFVISTRFYFGKKKIIKKKRNASD